jgi:hypothetical protein
MGGGVAAASPLHSVFGGTMGSPSPSLLSGQQPTTAEAESLRNELERLNILVSVKDEQMKKVLTDYNGWQQIPMRLRHPSAAGPQGARPVAWRQTPPPTLLRPTRLTRQTKKGGKTCW